MAYLGRYAPGQKALLGGGEAPAEATSAAPSAGPAPQAPPSSGAYTDFSAYLHANRPQAQAMANQMIAPVAAQADVASKTSVQPTQLLTPETPFDSIHNSVETLRGYGAVNTANAQRKAARDALSDQSLGQRTPGPGYTQGMATLDNFLMDGAGEGRQIADLRAKYTPLLSPLTQSFNTLPKKQPMPDVSSVGAAVADTANGRWVTDPETNEQRWQKFKPSDDGGA